MALTPTQKIDALRECVNVVEIDIEHLTALLHVEDELARKAGRYEGSGGSPLPEDLRGRFEAKLERLKHGRELMVAGIAKMVEAHQTASGSAEREPT